MQYLEVSLDDEDERSKAPWDGAHADGGVGAHASGARRRKNLLTLAAVGAAAAFVATLPALLMVVPTLHSLNQKSGQMVDMLATYVLGGAGGGSALEAALADMLAAEASTYAQALEALRDDDCVRFGAEVANATDVGGNATAQLPLALHFCPNYGSAADPQVLLELPRSYHGRYMKIIAHARSGPGDWPMINEEVADGTFVFVWDGASGTQRGARRAAAARRPSARG